ncbi:hypothetical protein PG994_008603 [Apiospora phragmitis]|uniref:Rhodopsin domain-containing protein n=1 Tax=Apiospora phragmitis TaxID=2905665 RepID=A0ABR1UGX9_9PEZI
MAGQTVFIPMLPLVRKHIIVESIVIALTTVVLGFRLLARAQALGLGANDYLVIAGYLLEYAAADVSVIKVVADRSPNFSPKQPSQNPQRGLLAQDLFTASPIYISCITCLKASVLLSYRRIFNNSTEWVRIATWGMLAMVAGWGLSFIMAMVFVCILIRKQWDTEILGTCYNAVEMYKALCITNIVTDLVIMALPVRVIWALQMRKAEKFALIVCFALGLCVCAIAAVRLSAHYDLEMQANLTGTIELTVFLAVLELCIDIVSISLPMLRPFYLLCGSNNHGLVTFGRSDRRKRYYLKRQTNYNSKQDDETPVSQWGLKKYQGQQEEFSVGDDAGSERRLAPTNDGQTRSWETW